MTKQATQVERSKKVNFFPTEYRRCVTADQTKAEAETHTTVFKFNELESLEEESKSPVITPDNVTPDVKPQPATQTFK